MSRLEDRFPWVFLVIAALQIVSVFLWAIEAMSGSKNVYVSVLFIILHLAGAWFCFSVWQKYSQKNEGGS